MPPIFPDTESYVNRSAFPLSESVSGENPFVDKPSKNVVEVVAENVKRCMQESRDYNSGPAIYRKTGVSVGTLSRILNKEVATGIDTLERLAEVFECEPWELMIPDDETREAIIALRNHARKRNA
jgi:hypothetical protein